MSLHVTMVSPNLLSEPAHLFQLISHCDHIIQQIMQHIKAMGAAIYSVGLSCSADTKTTHNRIFASGFGHHLQMIHGDGKILEVPSLPGQNMALATFHN